MPRAPYRPVEETEALRPVASPVDTFVTPQAPSRDTSLQDLARSLSGLGGNLGSFVEKRDKEAEEADRLRGQAAFWQSNGTGAAEGVSKGLIPAQASPQFMKGYKETEGEVAGGQLEQKFAAAYDTWEGKTSTDPKAYDQFIRGFLRDNIQTKDPDVLRGLIPKVHQVAFNYLQKHIGDASKATMNGYTTALSARGDQAIEDANSTGLATQHGTDYAGVFNKLDAIREEGLKTGATREQLDEKLIDTITANAVTKRDPKLLDFLDRKVPGQDYTWGNTPYGRDARQKTIDTLETMGRKSIADDEKKRREEKTEAKDTVTRETIQAITKAPNEPIPEDLLARGEKVDPDFRVNAIRWRDTIGKGTQTSDNGEMLAVTTDILNGGGVQTVQKAMARGVFKNPEDLTKAYKLAEAMTKEGPGLDGILKSSSAKIITDTIKARTAGEKNLMAMFDDGSVTPEGLQATTDFKLQVLAWRQDNPNANVIEQEKALGEIGAGILKRIQQPEVAGPVGYDRTGIGTPNTFDAGVPGKAPATEAPLAPGATATPTKPNPFGGRDAPQAPVTPPAGTVAPAAPQAPAPATPTAHRAQANPEQAGAWFNGLPAETRGAIEMKAAQEKKPLTLKMQELYRRGIERGIIAPPAAPAPTGATGKRSDLRAPDGTPIETASATVDATERTGRAFQEAVDAPATPDAVRLMGEAFQRALAGTSKPQGGYSSAALKDDPKAARILDFVAGPESGGNYNAYFGNGRSTKDLSAMSLDQVMAWSGNRGTESSATGRYQFMKKTLAGLKTEMGLSGTEPFTPALQDRMALQLLNRRGYGEWQAGRITDAAFANRLALEWASLPNITAQNGRPAGVSAYAGDGLNRSSVSAASVLSALTGRVGNMFRRKAGTERPNDGREV